MKKVNFIDLIELTDEISHPFSRKIFISKIRKKYGEGRIIKYDLGNGFAIFSRTFILNQDIILSEKANISGACLIFNLEKDLLFQYKDKYKHILKKDHFFIEFASEKFYCEIPIKKNEAFKSFFIGIKEELFLKSANLIPNIEKYKQIVYEKNYYILKGLQIDSVQLRLLNNFSNISYFNDALKSISLESNMTNLFHYTVKKVAKVLHSLSSNKYNTNTIFSLERAKEIIMQDYHKELSIKEIAYKSAINECYLKRDFKEYYGLTVFKMLQNRRLEVAQKLLQKDYSVKEVSFKVGYKHTSNFIKLFKKHFGNTPNEYRKTFT